MATTTPATTPSPTSWAVAPRSYVVDLALWLLICIPVVANPLTERRSGVAGDVLAAVAALALIVGRRRWPVPALAADLVGMVVATAVVGRPTALLPAVVVLLFTVAVRYDRTATIRAGLAGLAALVTCIAILVSSDIVGPELLAGLAWPTLAVAAGDAVRSRREAIAAAEERAARAEATREQEARRRVAEERLHIARELHDVVAHRIAVINVQAGVAAHLLRSRPDDADAALATVRTSARQVLDELAGILGVLRRADDEASTDPTPTLDDLPSLVASFDRAGLHVTFETTGDGGTLGDAASIAVYRTVQEALTNAHKHGDGRARLRVTHQPDAVDVLVANRIGADATGAGAGFGLVGMRERVLAAGGELTTGPRPDGTFQVHARFPALRHRDTP